jgi:hypothetical protein
MLVYLATTLVLGLLAESIDIFLLGHSDPKWGDTWANFQLVAALLVQLSVWSSPPVGAALFWLFLRRGLPPILTSCVMSFTAGVTTVGLFLIRAYNLAQPALESFRLPSAVLLPVLAGVPGVIAALGLLATRRWYYAVEKQSYGA